MLRPQVLEKCAACGHGNPGSGKFCAECGSALSSPAVAPVDAKPAGPYLPGEVPIEDAVTFVGGPSKPAGKTEVAIEDADTFVGGPSKPAGKTEVAIEDANTLLGAP